MPATLQTFRFNSMDLTEFYMNYFAFFNTFDTSFTEARN